MKRLAPLSLVALLLAAATLLACSSNNSKQTAAPTATAAAPTARLVVIDQNILHGIMDEDPAAEHFERIGERLPLIASALQQAQPDIVTLQEVLDKAGPDYPNVRQTILDALGPDYHAVGGSFSGGPIDSGGLGQMTFTRLPILSTENKSVSAIRSVIRVTVQTDSGPLSIYNVHLEGTGAVLPTGEDAAVQEVQNVIDFVQATRNGGPAIVSGDFNAKPDDPSIERFLQAGFIDTLVKSGDATCDKAGDPGCTNSTIPLGDNPENHAGKRIDYIFVLLDPSVDVTVTEAALFDNKPVDIGGGHFLWPSDHIGLRVMLELKARS